MLFHNSVDDVAEHSTLSRERTVAASQEFIADIIHILSESPGQNLGFERPHDSFVCSKDEGQIVLRRLGRCWTARLPLGRPMLDHEWFKPAHDLVDSLLQYLGDLALKIIKGHREVDSGNFASKQIVTFPDQLKHLDRGRLLAS